MGRDFTSQEILVQRIETYRVKNGLNYHELSSRLNLPYTTLSEIVHGKRVPRLDTVDIISGAMGKTTSELLAPAISTSLENVSVDTFSDTIRSLSDTKRDMLIVYLKMLNECTFID
ncbi:MAG: helix-turn-helix transcriptional regulator [Lachnospiraceae bacterium]|nr:helix-turn-helix transcriptional regulator [Lachnospiraceae bacterium]